MKEAKWRLKHIEENVFIVEMNTKQYLGRTLLVLQNGISLGIWILRELTSCLNNPCFLILETSILEMILKKEDLNILQ